MEASTFVVAGIVTVTSAAAFALSLREFFREFAARRPRSVIHDLYRHRNIVLDDTGDHSFVVEDSALERMIRARAQAMRRGGFTGTSLEPQLDRTTFRGLLVVFCFISAAAFVVGLAHFV